MSNVIEFPLRDRLKTIALQRRLANPDAAVVVSDGPRIKVTANEWAESRRFLEGLTHNLRLLNDPLAAPDINAAKAALNNGDVKTIIGLANSFQMTYGHNA